MESKIGEDFKSIQPDFTNIAPNTTFEGAVYSGGGGLFASDRRANNVGDIITVTLEENITAANSGNEKFTGTCTAGQNNSMNGTISVTVVRVFPNGNLEVKGERKLMYNSGTEYIRLAGVIRPEDISSTNTVSSTKVADAQISYTGTGDMNDSVTKGWLSRYFAYISPF